MGKHGPCCHCGVTSTPLWRNGPPEKPVLCNACGSRWRTKGSLTNYTPLHSRGEADEHEDHRVSKVKKISYKIGDEKIKKRKLSYENSVGKRFSSEYFLESIDEDTGNRSSSGSAGSNSDSFVQLSSADASDFTGSTQSVVWEAQVPSKKRTSMTRMKSSSPVEKLIKDLHAILDEQKSSYPEEDLLFETDVPMVSVEIGHGSVLIKHPSSFAREEDSEASSLSFENKSCETMEHKHAKRDQLNLDTMEHFLTRDSPLCDVDMNDVINFEVFTSHFTIEEKKRLLTCVSIDETSDRSLKSMFDSACFKKNVSYFQQLLSDGFFGSGPEVEGLELYTKYKEIEVESGSKRSVSKDLQSAKKPLVEQNLYVPGNKGPDKSGPIPKQPFHLGNLFHQPADSCHDESSDEDLLLDVPSNGSFPEAEFLLPPSNAASRRASTSCSSMVSAMVHH